MNKSNCLIPLLVAAVLLGSGCRVTMTLGAPVEFTPKELPAHESICLDIIDKERRYEEGKGLGFYFDPSEFFEAALNTELRSYFRVNTGTDCAVDDTMVSASLQNLHFQGMGGSAGPFPVSEAESYATIELNMIAPDHSRSKVTATSATYTIHELASSRIVMIVVARAAIRDAAKKSVQQLACSKGLTECSNQKDEQQTIKGAIAEYNKIKKAGEPKVEYSIFGYSFSSWF